MGKYHVWRKGRQPVEGLRIAPPPVSFLSDRKASDKF
jgi:hypothetical protein